LVNAPHTAYTLLDDDWQRPYTRHTAAFPASRAGENGMADKYWPPVARIDNVHGDKHLICSCPPLSDYAADLPSGNDETVEPEMGKTG